jgi:CheY-like chemotaxis protein
MASILIIEDVPAVLFSLKIVLEGLGHQITAAKNGDQGVRLLDDKSFDLVVTDIWMPGTKGTEVIRHAKTRWPRTRVLAITGGDPNSGESRDNLRGQDFGADQVLFKPFEKEQLIEAVSQLLKSQARADGLVS